MWVNAFNDRHFPMETKQKHMNRINCWTKGVSLVKNDWCVRSAIVYVDKEAYVDTGKSNLFLPMQKWNHIYFQQKKPQSTDEQVHLDNSHCPTMWTYQNALSASNS